MIRNFGCSIFVLFCCFAIPPATDAQVPRHPTWARQQPPGTPQISTVTPEVRKNRSDAFNDPTGTRLRLGEKSPTGEEVGTGSFADRGPVDPLPIAESTDIFVGAVTGYRAFFSSDHTAIYTELYVTATKVLKSHSQMATGDFTILESGGVLEEAGKALHFPPTGGTIEYPDVNERYVFLLKHNPHLQSYDVLEAWRLQNDHAIPMDLTQRAASQLDPKLIRYSQLTELEFLREIESESNNKK